MRYFLCLLFLCASVYADSLVVKSTSYVEDGYLSSSGANTNYGNGTTMRLYTDNSLLITMVPIIRIKDVGGLMSGLSTTIDSAFLKVYVAGSKNCTGYANYSVARVLKPFFEGDGTIGDGHPAGMTWNHWRDSTGTTSDSGWGVAGCGSATDSVDNRGNHAGPDRMATAIATVTGGAAGWDIINITTIARQWMGDTVAENGVLFYLATSPCNDNMETADTLAFYSSEYTTDTSLTPRFVFYYTASAPPATPKQSPYRQGPLGCDAKAGPNGASRRTGP